MRNSKRNEVAGRFSRLKTPFFDMGEMGVLGVEYSPESNKLYAGTVCNAGVIKEYEMAYDLDLPLDENLQAFYEIVADKLGCA